MQDTHPALVAHLEHLGQGVEQLRNSDEWERMLETSRRFHKYSFHNRVLIYLQNPEARLVAGYRKWQEMGRQVRKGEKGIKILRPITREQNDTDAGGLEFKHRVLIGFAAVSVFDYTQTEGDDIAVAEWPILTEAPHDLYGLIEAAVHSCNLTLRTETVGGQARAIYNRQNRTITVDQDLPQAEQCYSILHEMGHHFDPVLEAEPAIYREHRADAELVAESAAWLAGKRAGLDCDLEATHYLASWDGGVESLIRLCSRIGRIQSNLDTLLWPAVIES